MDVAPMLGAPPGSCFWVGFQWQPTVGRWMAHCGRRNEFRLISPDLLRSLVKEAQAQRLVVCAYRANSGPFADSGAV
jgi:hypothetical protein